MKPNYDATLRERARDPALTALLVLQCFMLLVAAPAAAGGYWGARLAFELSALGFAVLVFVIADGPVATTISVFAIACGVVVTTWRQIWALTTTSSLLDGIGSLTADLLIIYLVGRAVLAPGEITRHRLLDRALPRLGHGVRERVPPVLGVVSGLSGQRLFRYFGVAGV